MVSLIITRPRIPRLHRMRILAPTLFRRFAGWLMTFLPSIVLWREDFTRIGPERCVRFVFFRLFCVSSPLLFFDFFLPACFQSIGAGNHLSAFYESKVKASGERTVTDLAAERERSAALEKRVAELSEDVSSLQASLGDSRSHLEALEVKFASEGARLRRLRNEYVAAERKRAKDEISGYRDRIERMRRHILDTYASRDPLLTLSQVTRTHQCLEKLIGKGVPVPAETMLELEAERVTLDVAIGRLEIFDLLVGDLDPFDTGDAGAEVGQLGVVPGAAGENAGDLVPTDQ